MTDSNSAKEDNTIVKWVERNVTPLVTLAAFITTLFGGYFWLDNNYAKAEELAQLERRFEIKLTSDSIQGLNARIWQLEDRLQQKADDITAKEELRKLKENKANLERELENLQKSR